MNVPVCVRQQLAARYNIHSGEVVNVSANLVSPHISHHASENNSNALNMTFHSFNLTSQSWIAERLRADPYVVL